VSDWHYSCDRAAKSLVELVRLLADAKILGAPPGEGLVRECVQRCGPCNNGKGVRRCEGWHTVVDRGVLSFRPLTFPGDRLIRLDLSGDHSFRRSAPSKRDAWEERPLTSSTVTLEIVDVNEEALIERFHFDLANPGQAGSVWHLQYGGNPAPGLGALPTSWLDVPRWPSPPAELALAAEMITYNFYPAEWEALTERGEWLRLIFDAEELVMSHFVREMGRYFQRDRDERDGTWLMAQDNVQGQVVARL
jgi:hypothetical protein